MKGFLDRKVFVSMLFLALTMLGVVSYRQLDVELLPNTELPILYVRVQAPAETDPKYVEQKGVIPLEGIIGTLENIEEIESRVSPGSATIVVTLTANADLSVSYLKLLERIKSASSLLPDDFSASVFKVDLSQVTNQFMRIQVRGYGGVDRLRNLVEQDISDKFSSIDGVASVEVYGGRGKSVDILVDGRLMESHNITLGQIRQRIAAGQTAKISAGMVKDGGREYLVSIEADYKSLDELQNIVLKSDGPIRLKDLATVRFGVQEDDSYSRVNGKEAVTMTLSRESKENLIRLAERVQSVVDETNEEFVSQDVELSVEFNGAETMQTNIDKVISLAITGGILAIFLLWIFLRNIYLVFVAMVALPVSVYSAFNVFYGAGVSINILTLVGLALAVGMLIDNNVVVMENIHRLASSGRSFRESVTLGTKQVWRSVTASTLTTITVFLPFVFSSNVMFKQVARHISVSIVATLVISLVVALVLVPVLTYMFLRKRKQFNVAVFGYLDLHNRLVQIYIHLLKFCLRNPVRLILGAVVLLFVSIFLSLAVSVNTSKEAETASFYVTVEMPSGATLESTDKVVRELENKLDSIAERPDIIAQVYAETANLTIRLPKDFAETNHRLIGEIRQDVEQRIANVKGAEISVSQSLETSGSSRAGGMGGSRGGGFNIERMFNIGAQTEKVVIKGEDFDKMLLVANDVKYYLEENLDNIQSVSISTSSARPEVHLEFDHLLMGLAGITPQNVAQELAVFRSEIQTGGTFTLGNETYGINLKTTDDSTVIAAKKRMSDLKELQIESSGGSVVPLDRVSQIRYASGRSEINRVNQEKVIEVVYRFSDEVNNSNTLLEGSRADVESLVALIPMPGGVALNVVHDENPFGEFKFLILAAVILIYMILAAVFESFSAPFVMMFTVPLAAIGSLLALTLSGTSLLSLNTLVGFLILLGVVVNNGIILMDYVSQMRREGTSHLRALLLAGISRIRPVTITAGTTIIAMIPLAMGKAEYVGSLGAPFAITVIGGLGFSTILTLVFVPTFSYGLEAAINWFKEQGALLKVLMIVAWVLGLVMIFFVGDATLVWQLLYLVLLVAGVPALAWFVTFSLRQAEGSGIGSNDIISISIRNLVKVYERPSRFVREWNSRMAIINRKQSNPSKADVLGDSIWQLPLLGFLVYFVWFYVDGAATLFFGAIALYIVIPFFFTKGAIGVIVKDWLPSTRFVAMMVTTLANLFRYGYPLLACVLFSVRWHSPIGASFIAAGWYMVLIIVVSGKKLANGRVYIPMDKGRINAVKRWYWLTIRQMPMVGEKKKPFKALKSVSLEFKTGMIGLLGPNGAGKTTLMRIVCGILDQSYGKIYINGIDTSLKREELQGLIGYLPQEFGMYENMTAYDFLDYMAMLKGLAEGNERRQRIEYVLNAVHMFDRCRETIGSYSGGMKQRIGIAMILLHLPRILVVDEPTAGLDPSERIRFRNLLVELSRERVVLFSTHIIEDISSSCNLVAVMHKGDLKYWGEPRQMVKAAVGKVWQATIDEDRFDAINRDFRIVHHVKTGNKVVVRCLCNDLPFEGAVLQNPHLEDAYLLMLSTTKS
jgi:multidrug efflux pump subunit AcrB/ABC-type multidrug transport system ATPase subunit